MMMPTLPSKGVMRDGEPSKMMGLIKIDGVQQKMMGTGKVSAPSSKTADDDQ